MGGYAINHKRGFMIVVQNITYVSLPLELAWKYYPSFHYWSRKEENDGEPKIS